MALMQYGPYDLRSGRVSGNVTAVTLDSSSNYVSGGIVCGVAVTFDSLTGFPNDLIPCASAGASAIGIAISAPAADTNQEITYQVRGIARCLAGGVINPGDAVYVTDTSGRVGTAPGSATNYLLGVAVGPATVQAGDYMAVELNINAGKTTTP